MAEWVDGPPKSVSWEMHAQTMDQVRDLRAELAHLRDTANVDRLHCKKAEDDLQELLAEVEVVRRLRRLGRGQAACGDYYLPDNREARDVLKALWRAADRVTGGGGRG